MRSAICDFFASNDNLIEKLHAAQQCSNCMGNTQQAVCNKIQTANGHADRLISNLSRALSPMASQYAVITIQVRSLSAAFAGDLHTQCAAAFVDNV